MKNFMIVVLFLALASCMQSGGGSSSTTDTTTDATTDIVSGFASCKNEVGQKTYGCSSFQ